MSMLKGAVWSRTGKAYMYIYCTYKHITNKKYWSLSNRLATLTPSLNLQI